MEDGDRFRGRLIDCELHLGQHLAAPALRHQQGTPLPRRLERELLGVDEPHPGIHRVDAQPGERDVQERHGRVDGDGDLTRDDARVPGQ